MLLTDLSDNFLHGMFCLLYENWLGRKMIHWFKLLYYTASHSLCTFHGLTCMSALQCAVHNTKRSFYCELYIGTLDKIQLIEPYSYSLHDDHLP